MKTVITSFFCVAIALFLFLALPTAGEEQVYDSVLRLHVLANSDSTDDQNAKIAVRDALLSLTGKEMLAFSSLAEAEEWVKENESRLTEETNRVLRQQGCAYTARVSLETKHFDTRKYEDFTLPAGYYTALTVTLGEGKGQNFFCMLYPSLCVAPALGEKTEQVEQEQEKYTLFTDSGYALKLRSLEILSSLFEGK